MNPESVENYIEGLLAPVPLNGSLRKLSSATTLADAIKGGGDSIGGVETSVSYLLILFFKEMYFAIFLCSLLCNYEKMAVYLIYLMKL